MITLSLCKVFRSFVWKFWIFWFINNARFIIMLGMMIPLAWKDHLFAVWFSIYDAWFTSEMSGRGTMTVEAHVWYHYWECILQFFRHENSFYIFLSCLLTLLCSRFWKRILSYSFKLKWSSKLRILHFNSLSC